jgi:hypothetical protein
MGMVWLAVAALFLRKGSKVSIGQAIAFYVVKKYEVLYSC